ncbi:MAG: helix-turn-helix transcriptional regulator [Magnetospirillum sp.]|nr:helix-turn-helix transcriptional regulator [Magnetospirillum sp.]
MNAIKIVAETQDTVTVSREDWAALLAELEDSQDRAAVAERRAQPDARRHYLTAAEVRRLLGGEHPLKVWRTKRGLTQRGLAKSADVSVSYLAEIETGRKPGSAQAIGRLARALEIRMEDLVVDGAE